MGLDSVELILATEAEFGIEIADADAAHLLTPRQLAAHVSQLLGQLPTNTPPCQSQAAFYRIRRALCQQFGSARNTIRPDTPIAPYFTQTPSAAWRKLAQAIDAPRLPPLRCPHWLNRSLRSTLPLLALTLAIYFHQPPWAWLLLPAIAFLLAQWLLKHIAWQVPSHLQTLSDLVPYVRISNPAAWTQADVLQRVMQITAAELGLNPEQFNPDSRYVEDLGID